MTFDEDKVPSTVDEAIDMLVATMNDKEKTDFINVDGATMHHTLGTFIRDAWSLWEQNTPLQRDFINRFGLFGHADDMSAIFIASAKAKISGEDISTEQSRLIFRFKNHWSLFGLDPFTGVCISTRPVGFTIYVDPNTGETKQL